MDRSIFENMEKADLKNYIEFLLWHYRVIDGFWFLFASDTIDQETAEEINERVWAKAAELAARDLLKRFQFEEKGLPGFVKALRYYPWSLLIGYDVVEKEDEVIISSAHCTPQVARKQKGLPEFCCKKSHHGEFEKFAKVIDERIHVECEFAPPDPHPENLFCRWRFTLQSPNDM